MRWGFSLITLFLPLICWSQDTLFIRSLDTPERVINIDGDGNRLLIRMKDRILILPEQREIDLSDEPHKRFSWFAKKKEAGSGVSVYHTDFLPAEKVVSKSGLAAILPGFPTNHITAARADNLFYICYRGAVLEYRIDPFISMVHKGRSIRHVFCNDSLRIISGYNGIFLDHEPASYDFSTVPMEGSYYANGETAAIRERIYLCQDGLLVLENDTAWKRIGNEMEGGAFRKLIQWGDLVIAQLTNRVIVLDLVSVREVRTLLANQEFTDMELYGDTLMCTDTSGHLFLIHPDFTTDTISNLGELYDIHVKNNQVMLSGKAGVFYLSANRTPQWMVRSVPAIQAISTGDLVFFTNYEGLYVINKGIVYTLIGNVEFNKKALTLHNNTLYAGSIDGLFTITMNYFYSNVLPGLKPMEIKIDSSEISTWKWVTATLLLLLSAAAAWIMIRRNKSRDVPAAPSITPDSVTELIKSNPDLISVQSLADKLDTSVVQLNRKLRAFGESPLGLMQRVKKEIAMEMHGRGESMEAISKRTGYSRRYIRENFLNS